MAYLGNPPAEAYTNTVKDSFSGDGSTVAFTMSLPTTTNNVRVVVENVIQDPTVAYSCSGTTLTFTSAPPSGTNNIYVVHLGPAVMTTVPPTEITEATTYTSDLTVQGAFTSQGIDDNANATAITIDSSENVMFSTTDSSLYNQSTETGLAYEANAALTIARSGGDPLALNRLSSDGGMLLFQKDGSTVGSIFSSGGQYVGLGSGDVGLLYLGAADDIRPWNPSTNLARDNAIDLGNSDARFKDFYIAGDIAHKDAAGNARLLYDKSENLLGNAGTYLYGYGVYLGGTGSSNLLDDYEEGTFTPTLEGTSGDPTVSYGDQKGSYVKVGRIVHCTVQIRTTSRSGGAGNCRVGGFPFTCNQSTVGWQAGSVAYTNNFTSAPTRAMMQNGLNSVNLYTCDSTSNPRADHSTGFGVSLWANTGDLYFAISYETNS